MTTLKCISEMSFESEASESFSMILSIGLSIPTDGEAIGRRLVFKVAEGVYQEKDDGSVKVF